MHCKQGTCKVRNEIEMKRNRTKRKRNQRKRNETTLHFVSIGFVSFRSVSFRFVSHFTGTLEKSITNRENMKNSEKIYKKTMDNALNTHRRKMGKHLK